MVYCKSIRILFAAVIGHIWAGVAIGGAVEAGIAIGVRGRIRYAGRRRGKDTGLGAVWLVFQQYFYCCS